jgi:long-subunit fatty acid transport protein
MALFANPAGLAFLPGLRFKANLFGGMTPISAVPAAGGLALRSDPFEFRGSFAASWQFRDGVTAAIGIHAPDYFRTNWPYVWTGSRTSIEASLNTVVIRPALAVRLPAGLALGLGLDIVRARMSWMHILGFNLEKFPLPRDAAIRSVHEATGSGIGFTAGALWKAHRLVRFGARYQHGVPIDLGGKNTFVIGWENDFAILPDPVERQRRLYDLLKLYYSAQPVEAHWALPREFACGVELFPLRRLSFELDLEWTGWSGLGDWTFRSLNPEDELSPAFTPDLQEFYGIKPDYGTQSAGLVFRDSWRIKAGLEVVPAAGFALRAGYARHPSPLADGGPHPLLPGLDRDVVSFGFGYEGAFFSLGSDDKLGEISFDVFVQRGFAKKGVAPVAGVETIFRETPWTAGVGVGAIF